MPVGANLIHTTQWWRNMGNLRKGVTVVEGRQRLTLLTNAPTLVWGAHIGAHVVSGLWTADEAHFHINMLELLAVYRALQGLQETLAGYVVV